MMGFIKGILFALAGRYVQTAIDVVKVEVAIAIIKAIGGARKLFMLLSVWIFLLTLVAVGLAMIPVALCVFMPWEPTTKAIAGISLGAIYLLAPVIVLNILLSEKRWMRMTGATALLRKFVD